jgi:phosphodiesterase/alkaline phosphatase D-like protein
LIAALLLGASPPGGTAAAAVSFLAVGAGDATTGDAILWTRAQDSSSPAGVVVTAQVSTDPTFATRIISFLGVSDLIQDYTLHVHATGLRGATRYF